MCNLLEDADFVLHNIVQAVCGRVPAQLRGAGWALEQSPLHNTDLAVCCSVLARLCLPLLCFTRH